MPNVGQGCVRRSTCGFTVGRSGQAMAAAETLADYLRTSGTVRPVMRQCRAVAARYHVGEVPFARVSAAASGLSRGGAGMLSRKRLYGGRVGQAEEHGQCQVSQAGRVLYPV